MAIKDAKKKELTFPPQFVSSPVSQAYGVLLVAAEGLRKRGATLYPSRNIEVVRADGYDAFRSAIGDAVEKFTGVSGPVDDQEIPRTISVVDTDWVIAKTILEDPLSLAVFRQTLRLQEMQSELQARDGAVTPSTKKKSTGRSVVIVDNRVILSDVERALMKIASLPIDMRKKRAEEIIASVKTGRPLKGAKKKATKRAVTS
jgi:hypothetical protein